VASSAAFSRDTPPRSVPGNHGALLSRNSLRWAGTVWIVFLVVLSLQPLRLHAAIRGTASHVLLHVLLFGSAAVIPLLLSVNPAHECARALCVFCLTGAIEIAQGLIYGRRTEWQDLATDGIGVLIAFLAIRFWRIRMSMRGTGSRNP
jgi:hypothetical protein